MSRYGQQFDVNTTPKTSFGTRGGGRILERVSRLVFKCSVVQIGRGDGGADVYCISGPDIKG